MTYESYESSSAQKRLYLLRELLGETSAYNIPRAMMIQGQIDLPQFEEALRQLITRHESLRTGFVFADGEVLQQVYEEVAFEVEYTQGDEAKIDQVLDQFIRPFELSQPPLLRVKLVKVSEELHYLLLDVDHLIMDGFSFGIFTQELIALYSGKELPELELQYVDFVMWQNDLLESEEIKDQERYWLAKFQDGGPKLDLPTDFSRSEQQDLGGSNIWHFFDQELSNEIRRFTAQTKTTNFMFLLAVLNLLFSRYSNQEDLVIGSPIAGRQHQELLNIIGVFVNTLAIRNQPQGEKRFVDFLDEVKKSSLEAYRNQDYQFEMLVDQLQLERNLNQNPLFDVMFVLQNADQRPIEVEGLTFTPYRFEQKSLPIDLNIEAHDQSAQMGFNFQYATGLYRRKTIQRMIGHFEQIVRQVLANPEMRLREVDLLLADEKRWLLEEWNRTAVEFSPELTVHQLVEAQVRKTPEQIALVYAGQEMSYREWNRRANWLARILRERGVGPQQIVGVMVEPSFELAVGILAVLKAGAAYLPIDPAYPESRKEYLLADSQVQVLLSSGRILAGLDFAGEGIDLTDPSLWPQKLAQDENLAELENLDNLQDLEAIHRPDDLAYVIYTSGSTGKPKGVMVEHQSVANLLQWRKAEYQLTPKDVSLQLVSAAFDGFVVTFFTPLISGAKVVLLASEAAKNPERIGEVLVREQVTHFMAVPFLYGAILDQLDAEESYHLRSVGLAGDQITEGLRQKSRQVLPEIELITEYGPTESTVVTTLQRHLELEPKVTIGRPIANTQVYILDRYDQLTPVGVPGELCIGGLGLARGYLNQPELTQEKFVPHPVPGRSAERIYRTGDRARWTLDGKIQFLGRLDQQVKIRGLRIEIGEIENSLLELDGISEAVVLAFTDDKGEEHLGGYLVAEGELDLDQVRGLLAERVPNYMVPTFLTQLQELPVTAHGKLDRRALAQRTDLSQMEREYLPPTTELEKLLVEIYSQILQVEQVGITDHFFELGGHSLKAVSLITRINQACQVQLSVGDIFKTPRIQELAVKIQQREKGQFAKIERLAAESHYPLSSAQRRLFILDQLMGANTSFNMPAVLEMQQELDLQRLEETFQALMQRHESLRTSFQYLEGEPVQIIHPEVDFEIERFVAETEAEVAELIAAFIQPFDLGAGPLFRVGLIERVGQPDLLLLDVHHIISDGVSMMILMEELAQLYRGQPLAELPIQYRDYAHWQNQRLQSDQMRDLEAYWLEVFAGQLPVVDLPTDYQRPAVKSYQGGFYAFDLDQELTAQLVELAQETETTLFMVLLAVYNIFLAKYSNLEDVIVGTPTAGRTHMDLERVIGIFLNTLALRNYPRGEKSFRHFLAEVKENTLKAFDHQDYQFESLVDRLGLKTDLSRNPLFDVMFVFENMDATYGEIEQLGLVPYPFGGESVKYDLTLYGSEEAGQLRLQFAYRRDLFTQETIANLATRLVKMIQSVVEHPEIQLAEIQGTSAEKQQALLAGLMDDLEDE